MRQARIFVHNFPAARLIEHTAIQYEIIYDEDYKGPSISLTLPLEKKSYSFSSFPAFFDGLLPEGIQLEALLKQRKINKNDYFSQLLAVGEDLVGAVTVRPE
jgi:serine/threonine-protein kinase HipA